MKNETAQTKFTDQSILSFYKQVKNINRTFIEDKSDLYSYDFLAGAPTDSTALKCKIGNVKKLTVPENETNYNEAGGEKCNCSLPPLATSQFKGVKNLFKQKLKKSLANTPKFDF
jgi:hypothetical protein